MLTRLETERDGGRPDRRRRAVTWTTRQQYHAAGINGSEFPTQLWNYSMGDCRVVFIFLNLAELHRWSWNCVVHPDNDSTSTTSND